MKEIEKCEKKLKTWKWLNKHLGNCVLAVYLPLITAYLFVAPFSFLVSFVCLMGAFLTMVIGGFTKMYYADDENFKLLYEKQIEAMRTVSEEKIEILTKSIDNFKANPTAVKDKETTKRLIKELILIRKSAQKALEEKKNIEENTVVL